MTFYSTLVFFPKIRQKLGPNLELLIDHFNLKGMVNSSERKKIYYSFSLPFYVTLNKINTLL